MNIGSDQYVSIDRSKCNVSGNCVRICPADAVRAENLLRVLPIRIDPVRHDDLPRLRAVALEHGLTAYDAGYLELAMRNRLPLATLDEGLRRAARKAGVELL